MDQLKGRDDNSNGEQEGRESELAAPLLDRSAFSFFSQGGGGTASPSIKAGDSGSEEDGLEMVEKTPSPTCSEDDAFGGQPTELASRVNTKEGLRFRSGELLLAAVVVGALVGAAPRVLVAPATKKPTPAAPAAPTPSPTHDPSKELEQTKNRQTIVDAFGEDYFDNPQKEEALQWILYEDPRSSLEHENTHPPNPVQRFALASMYLQTSANHEWAYCNRPVDNTKTASCVFATDFFTRNDESFAMKWLSKEHECDWMGVFCHGENRSVTQLDIRGNNITGQIPASELAQLTGLEKIILSDNNLTGPVPGSMFQDLHQLKRVSFGSNKLTGSIPPQLSLSSTLVYINFVNNKLTGSIPPQLFLSSSMSHVILSQNQLTGSIPTEIGLFKGSTLSLHENRLAGPIPEETYNAVKMQSLSFSDNLLTGTLSAAIGSFTELLSFEAEGTSIEGKIPSEIGLLSMRDLNLKGTNMDGTIPEELYNNKHWQYIRLDSCQLSGTISTRIGQLAQLASFGIANNTLHGTLPTELSSIPHLRFLSLNGNGNLTGSIPENFCSPAKKGLEITADCTPIASTGVPAMFCPKACCSTCCEAETGKCVEN